MSEPGLLVLRQTLAEAARDDLSQPPHARAFAAWIQPQSDLLASLAIEAAESEGPARQTSHVSVLGFAASVNPTFRAAFLEFMEWLTARQFFVPGRPLSLEVDGLGLLGIAVGLQAIGHAEATSGRLWLDGLLNRTLQAGRPVDWNESLIRAGRDVLSVEPVARYLEGAAPDLRVALSAKGLMPMTAAVRADAWEMISSLATVDDMTRAAAQMAALAALLRDTSTVRLGSTTIEQVARLLDGVERSMRRWPWELEPRTPKSKPARWDVENEYHVQDMLWAILAPVFPDLDDEEWLKSLGHHHPRADLAIPSLELIIEVKFLRRGTNKAMSDLIQEVAADASTYLPEGGPFRHIIAFVWDDTASTEQHPELRQGLLKINGVADAIVLPRPRKMQR